MTRSLLASLLLGLLSASASAGPTPFTPADADRAAAEAIKEWGVPGAVLVVVRDGKTIVAKGYGVRKHGIPDAVDSDTLFPLASGTKAFTSAVLASLVDDGKLGWDDPVRKHLPTFRLSDPRADALVTVRDLVTHRTGVARHDLLLFHAPWDRAELIRRIGKLPLAGEFRGSYWYNSLLFAAAGQVAANRGDAGWEELVRDRLVTPLGMTGVAITPEEQRAAKNRATGHTRGADGTPTPVAWYTEHEPNPSNSICATANDLPAWLNFQLADGTHAGKRLVSAANLRETKTPQTPMRIDDGLRDAYPDTVQASYAMGWVVYDHRGRHVVGHGGAIDGFRGQFTLLPKDKVGIAVLTNLAGTRMTNALTNTLIDRLCGLEPKDWNPYFRKLDDTDLAAKKAATEKRDRDRKPDVKPSVSVDAFAGEYAHPAYGTAKVKVADGKLVWEWSSFRLPLEHWEADAFRIRDGLLAGEFVTFETADGAVSALTAISVRFAKSK